MLSNLLIVAEQVIILFILIFVGFFCGKSKLINDIGAKHLTDIVLYLATPCVIVKSFQEVSFDFQLLVNLGITTLCATLIQVISIFACKLIFKSKDISRQKVLQFATVFSNCGFMSLPLQNALLGSTGVFYGSIFVAIFNIIVWSYGLVDMSGNKKDFNFKKILLNPGVLGVSFALILFFTNIKLPELISTPINYIAGLNTPVPMLVIGYYLSGTNFIKYLKDKGVYAVSFARLITIPLISLFVMWLCGVKGEILIACTVAASAPTAATTTMFATKFSRDVELSVNLVSITTMLSIITMPIIIALAKTIA